MRKVLIVVAVQMAIATLLGPTTPASAEAKPRCPDDKPLVVDATLRITNLADVGTDGHVWALDSFDRHLRIWQTGTNAFCIRTDDAGTFTSFAGVSPGGTGTISEGVTGTWIGSRYLRVYGTFAPTVSTTGYLGEFDAACDQSGACGNIGWRATRLYFSRVNSAHPGWFFASFDGGAHGVWVQTLDGDVGDITG